MINGTVKMIGQGGPVILWEPRIKVAVAGISMNFEAVEAVVDTGFTGALALPSDIVQELGLTYRGEREVRLATGQDILYIYGATVSWLGESRVVAVYQVDGNPLVGAALLTNCQLVVDFREGGEVIIQPHWTNQHRSQG